MPLTWADLRNQARRLLTDTTLGKYKWSDEQMLDFVAWSLDALCSHTALVTATVYVADGDTDNFELPDNIYEPIEKTGSVYLDDGTSVKYLNPIRLNRRNVVFDGYYELPTGTLNLIRSPAIDDLVTVQYFAYYPHPVSDSDLMLSPTWATSALAFRIAAYGHASKASKTANIRQWGQKPDTGNPEDNPLMDQSRYYFIQWEKELYNAPRQERENYFYNASLVGRVKNV